MRIKIIKLAIRKNRYTILIPVAVIYLVLPIIGYFEYQHSGLSGSLYTIVFASQSLFPLCCLLMPMAHFAIWFNPYGHETLIASSHNHRCCTCDMLCMYLCIAVILLPASLFFNLLYGPLGLECIRLYAQCIFCVSLFYLCTVCCKNTTLGALPIIVYLFMCVCLNDLPEYNKFSILELHRLATLDSIVKYIILYVISICFLIIGNKIERNGNILRFRYSKV